MAQPIIFSVAWNNFHAMAASLSGSGGIEQQSPVFDPNRDAAQVLNPARVDVIKNGLKF